MATYLELAEIQNEVGYSDWVLKLNTAIEIKAYAISQEATPTALEITWAKEALADSESKRPSVENYMLAANSSASIVAILAASDTGAGSIQTAVDAAVDDLLSL